MWIKSIDDHLQDKNNGMWFQRKELLREFSGARHRSLVAWLYAMWNNTKIACCKTSITITIVIIHGQLY